MQSMNEAISLIGQKAGVGPLSIGPSKAAEIIVNGVMPVYFQQLSETELEVSVRVVSLKGAVTGDLMRALLEANARMAVGRLSMEPETGAVLHGMRIDVALVSGDAMIDQMNDFIREAATWNVSAGPDLLDALKRAGGRARTSLDHGDEVIFRA